MRMQGKLLALCALGGLLAIGTIGTFVNLSQAQNTNKSAITGQPGAATEKKDTDSHQADRQAIRQRVESFVKAFESGDAAAVAAHWTEAGEYIADDGTTLQGREAIKKAYAKLFAKNKKFKVKVDMLSLRFPSKNTAIEEGYFRVRKGEADSPTESRYSVLHVRENGKWLMALVREWPAEAVSVRDLGWLIGTWKSERNGVGVQTTYEWLPGKAFIRANFTIKEKERTFHGFKIIGKDPSTARLRSWTFERDGGFGEANWERDGKKWIVEAAGVLTDGSTMTATNIMTKLDNDSFIWHATNRTMNGEPLPDVAPIRVNRMKAKK